MGNTEREISERLTQIFENVMKIEHEYIVEEMQEKISMTEVHAIAAIGVEELGNMSEIAKRLGITMGTLTVCVNNLVKKRYVERYKNEQDRRIVKLGLTKQGKAIYKVHEKFHICLTDAMNAGMTESEKLVIGKAISNIEKFIGEGK